MLAFACFMILPVLFLAIMILVLTTIEERQLIKYAEKSLKRKLSDWEKQLIQFGQWPYLNELRKCFKQKIPFEPTSKPIEKLVEEINKKSKEKNDE